MFPPARKTVVTLWLVVIVAYAQNFCSTDAACYTPARGPGCPAVHFGWGNCPGSRAACDWCYGPGGSVFAYTPRGSTYTLSSGCNSLGPNTTWGTRDSRVQKWMTDAGGSCTPDGRGGYTCSGVDAAQFKREACASPATAPSTPPPSEQPAATSASDACSCYTPARGATCPQVRFGWGDCPGSRQACDWCYGPNGVFAYFPRGSVYTLGSGCNQLGGDGAIWSTRSSQVEQLMTNAGGSCTPDGKGGYSCSNVDAARYKQAAGCGGAPPACDASSPNSGGAAKYSRTTSGATGACGKPRFIYFYINGINTPMTSSDWRGNYTGEYGTVALNLVDDYHVLAPPNPFHIAENKFPATIKVGSETDAMYGPTHNLSGKDPTNAEWIAANCTPDKWWNGPVCLALNAINGIRSGSLSGGFALGDLGECIRQSINLPSGVVIPGIDVAGQAITDPTVQDVVKAIERLYSQGLATGQPTYLIVISHSQGNFFAEAIAYYLKDHDPDIFNTHFGVVSLGSPTDFASLGRSNTFIDIKIVHHTRTDDAINLVASIGNSLKGVSSKRPWEPNDAPLWPWPKSGGWDYTLGITASHNYSPRPDLFNNVWAAIQRIGYSSGVVPNPELYSPLLNSHLLDNYLDSPPPTLPRKALNFKPSLVPWLLSPATTSVLNCVRRDLIQLKKNLLYGTTETVTRPCSGY